MLHHEEAAFHADHRTERRRRYEYSGRRRHKPDADRLRPLGAISASATVITAIV